MTFQPLKFMRRATLELGVRLPNALMPVHPGYYLDVMTGQSFARNSLHMQQKDKKWEWEQRLHHLTKPTSTP